MKTFFEGGWHHNIATASMVYVPSGYYEEGALIDWEKIEGKKVLSRIEYEHLLRYIRDHEVGVIKTDRTEDLKIIHRLLDVLEKGMCEVSKE